MKELLTAKHQEAFGKPPAVCTFAPGRVNFIGEHTDYNGGLVMPLALEKGIYVAVSAAAAPRLTVHSIDFNKTAAFDLAALLPDPAVGWANCPKGIVKVLMDNGYKLGGMDVTITGDLPIGAGLSSSAATEVSVGLAAATLFKHVIERPKLALMAQKAEHTFTGTQCGIMDQLVSVLGKKDMLVQINCETLSATHIPFQLGEACLLITNTKVSHELATSAYNTRRDECRQGFEIAQKIRPSLRTLSEFTVDELAANKSKFPTVVYDRLHHVLSENSRVLAVAEALKKNDLAQVGTLLTASHRSLQHLYQVTCPELDWLVDNATALPGVYGSRMTGGGFGGCTITLLDKKIINAYQQSLVGYAQKFKTAPAVYPAVPSDGARVL